MGKTILLLLWASIIYGSKPICVRNLANQGLDVCSIQPIYYTYFQALEPKEKAVCTRIYVDKYCNSSPEFVTVAALDGRSICVLNFNQPPLINYCESLPRYYSYLNGE